VAAADAKLAVAGSPGGNFLVVSACGAVRVGADGSVMGPAIPLGAGGLPDAPVTDYWRRWGVAAAVGSEFFFFNAGEVARIDAAGALVSRAAVGFTPEAVASDGARMLAVWPGGAAFVDSAGAVVAPGAFALPRTGNVAVAFDGSAFVLLATPASPDPGFWSWRILPDGTVPEAPALLKWIPASATGGPIALASDGRAEVGVWHPGLPTAEWGGTSALVFHDAGPAAVLDTEVAIERTKRWWSAAANPLGLSVLVADGGRYHPYAPDDVTYYPLLRVVRTWAPLSVTRTGSGQGNVASAPAGIDCGATCLAQFDAPTTVTLTATAEPGSAFVGWTGACTGAATNCTVTTDEARSVEARFDDVEPPTVTVPEDLHVVATSALGGVAAFTATAVDGLGGPLTPTCAPASGSLFAPGTTLVTCTATDAAGNAGAASFHVVVTFDWSGILQPVNADGSSVFKLGRTVPVKFALAGASAAIPDLAGRLSLAKITDGVTGSSMEAASTAAADSGNQFRYDPASAQYVFNLATRGLSQGTWQLQVDLGDGVVRTVTFSLRP